MQEPTSTPDQSDDDDDDDDAPEDSTLEMMLNPSRLQKTSQQQLLSKYNNVRRNYNDSRCIQRLETPRPTNPNNSRSSNPYIPYTTENNRKRELQRKYNEIEASRKKLLKAIIKSISDVKARNSIFTEDEEDRRTSDDELAQAQAAPGHHDQAGALHHAAPLGTAQGAGAGGGPQEHDGSSFYGIP